VECSLNRVKCPLSHVEHSLNHDECSLSYVEFSDSAYNTCCLCSCLCS
jgi:hypothetical protein